MSEKNLSRRLEMGGYSNLEKDHRVLYMTGKEFTRICGLYELGSLNTYSSFTRIKHSSSRGKADQIFFGGGDVSILHSVSPPHILVP